MNRKLISLFFLSVLLLLPVVALAASPQLCNQTDPGTWFTCIINNLLNVVVWPVFVGLVLVMFVWAGILFLTARGDPNKIDAARRALIWAVVGIIIGLIAFSAVTIIKATLGIQ